MLTHCLQNFMHNPLFAEGTNLFRKTKVKVIKKRVNSHSISFRLLMPPLLGPRSSFPWHKISFHLENNWIFGFEFDWKAIFGWFYDLYRNEICPQTFFTCFFTFVFVYCFPAEFLSVRGGVSVNRKPVSEVILKEFCLLKVL